MSSKKPAFKQTVLVLILTENRKILCTCGTMQILLLFFYAFTGGKYKCVQKLILRFDINFLIKSMGEWVFANGTNGAQKFIPLL